MIVGNAQFGQAQSWFDPCPTFERITRLVRELVLVYDHVACIGSEVVIRAVHRPRDPPPIFHSHGVNLAHISPSFYLCKSHWHVFPTFHLFAMNHKYLFFSSHLCNMNHRYMFPTSRSYEVDRAYTSPELPFMPPRTYVHVSYVHSPKMDQVYSFATLHICKMNRTYMFPPSHHL